MSATPITYPFDPTGSAATNLVLDERHIVSPPQSSPFYFLVPFNGPFFEQDLEITRYPSGQKLIMGTDYQLAWSFVSASRATAKPVYSAISLMNPNISGVLSIKLRYLGGDWQIDEARATELLLHNRVNPRITSWEQVQDLPYGFPVIDHEWDLNDMVGASDVVSAIDRVVAALLLTGSASIDNHLVDYENPHQTTAAQIGAVPASDFETMLASYLTANPVPNSSRLGGSTKAELLTELNSGSSIVINLNNPYGAAWSHWMDIDLMGHQHDISFFVSHLSPEGVGSLALVIVGNMPDNRVKFHSLYGRLDYNIVYTYNDATGILSIWALVRGSNPRFTLNMLSGNDHVTHVASPGVTQDPPTLDDSMLSKSFIDYTDGQYDTGIRAVTEIVEFPYPDTMHIHYHSLNTRDIVLHMRVLTETQNIVNTHYEAFTDNQIHITASEPVAIRAIITYYVPEVPVPPIIEDYEQQ